MSPSEVLLLLLILLFVFGLSLPAYVIGRRRGLQRHLWVAFIPFFGATIVMLWSMEESGWMTIIPFIPIVGFIWTIWFAVAMPAAHSRTRWWAPALLFLPVIGHYVYAFTLADLRASAGEGVIAAS